MKDSIVLFSVFNRTGMVIFFRFDRKKKSKILPCRFFFDFRIFTLVFVGLGVFVIMKMSENNGLFMENGKGISKLFNFVLVCVCNSRILGWYLAFLIQSAFACRKRDFLNFNKTPGFFCIRNCF